MIIGIGGCSRSGKSTLADDLAWHFRNQNKRAIVVHQDDFVFKINDIPLINGRTDWDTPASLDFELMTETLLFFQQSFEIVLLEGHFVFSNSKLNTLFNHRIFIEISEHTYLQRRASETRWGVEPAWFINHVWHRFLKYGQPNLLDSNLLVLSGETPFEIEKIVGYLAII